MQAQQLTSRSFLVIICIPLTQDVPAPQTPPERPAADAARKPAATRPSTADAPAGRARAARPKAKAKANVMKAVMKKTPPKK